MKWWAFNEEQLEAALDAWNGTRGEVDAPHMPITEAVREFLLSAESRQHKLRGDAEN